MPPPTAHDDRIILHGVFRDVTKATYEEMLTEQIKTATEKMGPGNLEKLINSGDTWVIE